MREIKFRAWDMKKKQMLTIFDSSVGSDWYLPSWKENYKVMQYTGLTDKNGAEIYDDDLLTDMDGDVFEVFYNTAHCAYMAEYVRTKHVEKKRGYFRLGDQCSLTIEVIGNIWENLELLKQF